MERRHSILRTEIWVRVDALTSVQKKGVSDVEDTKSEKFQDQSDAANDKLQMQHKLAE
jgi:hypothetical protein